MHVQIWALRWRGRMLVVLMDSSFSDSEEKEIKVAVEEASASARNPEQLVTAVRAREPRMRRWKVRLEEAPERVTMVVDPLGDKAWRN